MARRILAILCCLISFPAFAQVLVVVLDQELGGPLEGVSLRVQGSDQVFLTNARGEASLAPPPGGGRLMLTAQLLGYTSQRIVVPAGRERIEIGLVLAGAIEGQELVVEAPRPQESDAQAGVSVVATSQDIQALTMGLVEDAMSAVKALPGVGYAGAFDSMPSINGGDPHETVAILDGAYVLYPYQWAGTYTIFNPAMVDSIKLSGGIIGAPYGQVLSGLLEVSSKTPTDSFPHLDFGLSTTGLDLFYHQAFGDKGGLLLGGKVTWMELPLVLIGMTGLFATPPYIRNGTARLFWNPSPRLKWSLNANLDTDGVSIHVDEVTAHLFETELLVSSTLKVLVSDKVLWTFLAGYNSVNTDSGINDPNPASPPHPSYSDTTEDQYLYQARTSLDWTPSEGQVISLGLDGRLENWSQNDSYTYWTGASYATATTFLKGKNTLTSGAYVNDSFRLIPGVLEGEAGLRLDHSFVYGGGEVLQTYPVVNPRLLLAYTFLRDRGALTSLGLSLGTGLYSQFPADDPNLDAKYGVVSLEVGPTRAWVSVLGLDAKGRGGGSLEIMTYYKYYLHRFYPAVGPTSARVLRYDGSGFAYGLNLGLKKQSRLLDLALSYSFSHTELYNPGGPGITQASWTSPLGAWYFPHYQVFHTLHLGLTLKPGDGFSLLCQASLASGAPTQGGGRSAWRYPVDLKLDWHGFFAGSKTRWEVYLGCEDILALLYSQTLGTVDSGVSFSVGYPIPSVGFKLSY